MNPRTILDLVMEATSAELEDAKDELTAEQKEAVANNMKYLTEEMLALALSQDETKREYHRANIAHYKAAMLSISAVVRMRAYQSTINIIGRVIAGIAVATGKALV
jgi:hypothetical protein